MTQALLFDFDISVNHICQTKVCQHIRYVALELTALITTRPYRPRKLEFADEPRTDSTRHFKITELTTLIH